MNICIVIFRLHKQTTAFVARMCVIVLWLVTTLNFYDNLPSSSLKYIFCILPNPALNFAFQVMFQFERSGKLLLLLFAGYECSNNCQIISIYNTKTKNKKGPSLYLSNIFENIFSDSLNVGSILIVMFLNAIVIYLPCAWYVDKVIPNGQFGVPLPFYFVFMVSCWPFFFFIEALVFLNNYFRDMFVTSHRIGIKRCTMTTLMS